jgi:hypothetical protein
MQMIKLTFMLSLPIFMILCWPLALATASTPLVAHYGVIGCVLFAAVTATLCSWLIVAFIRDLKHF